jgi:NAD(P)H-nitrite reductase large subunit
MEAASSLISDMRQVTIVAQDKVPFERVMGPEIGQMFRQLHEGKGVKFVTEVEVTPLLGEAGHVSGVQLETGQNLPAEAVVLGVGVRPATDFLKDVFDLGKDGSVPVDAQLWTTENVYAAGNIARWPLRAHPPASSIGAWPSSTAA